MTILDPRDARAFGRALRQLRAGQHLTQEQLAHRADTHRNYVGAVERGTNNPTFGALLRFARALDVDLSELIHLFEERRRD